MTVRFSVSGLRGRYSECRVIDIAVGLRLPWVRGVRLATRSEDKNGVDIVVAADVGPIGVQVKSSACGAEKWRRENDARGDSHRNRFVALIVAGDRDDDAIAGDLLAELARVRGLRASGR